MDPFREATYEQLERVVEIIDRLKPIELPGMGIPSIGFLEKWVEDKVPADENNGTTEWVIRMWENARPRKEQ